MISINSQLLEEFLPKLKTGSLPLLIVIISLKDVEGELISLKDVMKKTGSSSIDDVFRSLDDLIIHKLINVHKDGDYFFFEALTDLVTVIQDFNN